MEAPIGGMTNDFLLASAPRSTLYLLYLSSRINLLSPDGLSFSLGILKKTESPCVALT
jgi:hypothetical protein